MASDPTTRLQTLATAIHQHIQQTPDVRTGQKIDLPNITNTTYSPVLMGQQPRATQFIPTLLASPHAGAMAQVMALLAEVQSLLTWRQNPNYTVANVGQQFLDNFCHATLTSADGPLQGPTLPMGWFVLFGPHTLYKTHQHPPNEIYLAITAGGEWQLGTQDWQALNAGDALYIPSNTPHAIRTHAKPILTYSIWLEDADLADIEI